jgi:DNA-binding NtrC family response regulator
MDTYKILHINYGNGFQLELDAMLNQNFSVTTTDSTIDAYNHLMSRPFDVVIAEHNLPSMSGIEFLQSIATDFPKVKRILITEGTNSLDLINAVNKAKVFSILLRPFDMEEVNTALVAAIKDIKSTEENEKLVQDLIVQNQQFEFILRQRLLS